MTDQKPYLQVTDIGNWLVDREFAPYPEGSRSKYAVICPEDVDEEYLIPHHRYLFKHSNPNFPEQFWAEIIAYIVGKHSGVKVPLAIPCVNTELGEVAALIEWFYGPGISKQRPDRSDRISKLSRWAFRHLFSSRTKTESLENIRYVPGSNYMVRLISGYDLEKGKQHNVRSIIQLCRLLEASWGLIGGMKHWAQVFTFDALIGNTDRHQDNWGLIWYGGDSDDAVAEFAPAFDNGTALGHEILEGNLSKFEKSKNLERYVLRGRHHVRWKVSDKKRCQHIELIRILIDKKIIPRDVVKRVLSFDMAELEADIEELRNINIAIPFTNERCGFVIRLLKERYRRLQEVLNGHPE